MASRPVLIAAAARDPFVSELVQLLEAQGTEVLIARGAEAAVKAARSRQPAVIVLDTVLTDGDGLSLCRLLKSDPSTEAIPVFFFSVLMARDRCVEAGADDFMQKPIEQELLVKRIRDVLDSRVRKLPHQPR